tara:strand:- start:2082 stop:2225 length:144 start_codon:yes stop_codon:yes gene_type:complete
MKQACEVHHVIAKEIVSLHGMGMLEDVAATVPAVHLRHISMPMHLGN